VDDYTWTTEEFDNPSLASYTPPVSTNPFLAPREVAVNKAGHKPEVSVHLPPPSASNKSPNSGICFCAPLLYLEKISSSRFPTFWSSSSAAGRLVPA